MYEEGNSKIYAEKCLYSQSEESSIVSQKYAKRRIQRKKKIIR